MKEDNSKIISTLSYQLLSKLFYEIIKGTTQHTC
jgi:hypothetical protein